MCPNRVRTAVKTAFALLAAVAGTATPERPIIPDSTRPFYYVIIIISYVFAKMLEALTFRPKMLELLTFRQKY